LKILKNIFERCIIYGVSLNLKKRLLVVVEGKFLGNFVSKEGVYTDPERIKAINDLNPPTSTKGVQSFFKKINFVWIFVPIYSSIVKPINKLLNKDHGFEWKSEIQKAFTEVKQSITTTHVLVSLDFDKDFILYCFSLEKIVASIITQKNQKQEELPIVFMIKTLHAY